MPRKRPPSQRPRSANGTAERRMELKLPAELDDAASDAARVQRTSRSEWWRQAGREKLARNE